MGMFLCCWGKYRNSSGYYDVDSNGGRTIYVL